MDSVVHDKNIDNCMHAKLRLLVLCVDHMAQHP